MNSLPNQPQNDASAAAVPQPQPPATAGAGLGGKETEIAMAPYPPEQTGLVESGRDMELPKEVASHGVRIAPTQIPVPQNLAQAGVKPAGDNVTIGSGQTVTLPLSDDQIAQGLNQDVASSWRWLAEWCVRKLKQIQLTLRLSGGKLPPGEVH